MLRSCLVSFCVFALGLAGGCGDSDGGGAADTVIKADTAQGGSDAADGQSGVTDTTGGGDTGTSTPRCTADTDCTGAGEICTCQGTCVVPAGSACTEDRNCGIPNWCNDCTGHCEPQAGLCEPCTLARGCKDNGACIPYAAGGTTGGNFCGQACVTDVGCPTGHFCVDVPGVDMKQCVARSGQCEDLGLCDDDGDCPDAEICNGTNKQCAPGCIGDLQCPAGQVCARGRCGDPCTSDLECTVPAECELVSGKCKIPGACEVSAECTDAETYCDKVEGMCKAGCLVDADCKDAGKVCASQACVRKGCEHNYQCAFGEVCEQASGDCVAAVGPYCADCSEGSGTACDAPNACATFQDENEMPLGDFCLVACQDDPIDACPQGYQCQQLDDPNGGAPMFVCARQCYVDPPMVSQ